MCLAIFKPADSGINKEYLRNAFIKNDDGAGFAYSRDGQLFIQKGFMDFESFFEAFCSSTTDADPCLIHFRIGTSGKKNEENCHPWPIDIANKNPEVCFIHNGVLGDFTPESNSPISDTGCLRDQVLLPIYKLLGINFFIQDWMYYFLRKIAGSFNKFVFLNALGKVAIINEDAGVWQEGCWFSNESFKPAKQKEAAKPQQIQYYRVVSTGEILHDKSLHNFVSRQMVNGKNSKKLKKLLKSGILQRFLYESV